jgi:phosphatidylglycerophosphate synthase
MFIMTTSLERATAPRRPLATRNAAWAKALARWLAAHGVRPNAVSIAGLGFSVLSATAFSLSGGHTAGDRAALLVVAAAGIQTRLLCNLLDGMLAVEQRLKSRTGEVCNDLPDRIADVVILVGAGYAVPQVHVAVTLGWAAAVSAVFTAYVRVLGASLGLTQWFIGPMAKPHRMFILTAVTLLAAVEAWLGLTSRAMPAGLGVIVAGAVVTAIRRTRRIRAEADSQ